VTYVLDASAVLALLRTEPGHEEVAELLPGSLISAVNYSEVVQKLSHLGSSTAEDDAAALIALGATVAPFDVAGATSAAGLWRATRGVGLSLADRACLALAADVQDGVAVTADRAWKTLELDVRVRLIR
jgi:PIN domain nuclease of toxin-antitoxin system